MGCASCLAQEIPGDFLPASFHKERRELLRAKLPTNSVAVVFANPERNRANDVDYLYHQDPDFYYLTGYREPNAVLLVFSEEQTGPNGNTFDEVIFVQERDPRAEQWNGKRLGVEGVKKKLGFEMVYNGSAFKDFPLDFDSFDTVTFLDFKNDYRDKQGEADLFDLIKTFKERVDYPADFNATRQQLYKMITATDIENSANVAQNLGRYLGNYPELRSDAFLSGFVNTQDLDYRKGIQKELLALQRSNNLDASTLGALMNSLREVKTKDEIRLMTKAISISAIGQVEVMKAMHPNMSETEIQGVHEFVYKKYGSEYEGYPSIVGGGSNGCILHYIENNKPKVGTDLVLMDLGAEYHGYTADVTRTIRRMGRLPKHKKRYTTLCLRHRMRESVPVS